MPEARQIPIVTDNSIYLATEIYEKDYRANKIGQNWNLFGKKAVNIPYLQVLLPFSVAMAMLLFSPKQQ